MTALVIGSQMHAQNRNESGTSGLALRRFAPTRRGAASWSGRPWPDRFALRGDPLGFLARAPGDAVFAEVLRTPAVAPRPETRRSVAFEGFAERAGDEPLRVAFFASRRTVPAEVRDTACVAVRGRTRVVGRPPALVEDPRTREARVEEPPVGRPWPFRDDVAVAFLAAMAAHRGSAP